MKLFERVDAHLARRIRIKSMPSLLTQSIVSIAFDDFPKSSWCVGGPILARYKVAATYYVSGSLCGSRSDGLDYFDADDLAGVYAAGHEIGSHTFSHHRVWQLPSDALLMDAKKNETFIREHAGNVSPETFAYPYGETSMRTKMLFARHFACCRGTGSGVNRSSLDLGQLKVVSLERYLCSKEMISRRIAEAISAPCWIIFYTHDISDNPSAYGSKPSVLEGVIEKTKAAGIEILTVKSGLARSCYRDTVA